MYIEGNIMDGHSCHDSTRNDSIIDASACQPCYGCGAVHCLVYVADFCTSTRPPCSMPDCVILSCRAAGCMQGLSVSTSSCRLCVAAFAMRPHRRGTPPDSMLEPRCMLRSCVRPTHRLGSVPVKLLLDKLSLLSRVTAALPRMTCCLGFRAVSC